MKLQNEHREKLWEEFISGKAIVVNFAEAKSIKFKSVQLQLSQARHHAFVVVSKESGHFYIQDYANGLKWEACPICGNKL